MHTLDSGLTANVYVTLITKSSWFLFLWLLYSIYLSIIHRIHPIISLYCENYSRPLLRLEPCEQGLKLPFMSNRYSQSPHGSSWCKSFGWVRNMVDHSLWNCGQISFESRTKYIWRIQIQSRFKRKRVLDFFSFHDIKTPECEKHAIVFHVVIFIFCNDLVDFSWLWWINSFSSNMLSIFK